MAAQWRTSSWANSSAAASARACCSATVLPERRARRTAFHGVDRIHGGRARRLQGFINSWKPGGNFSRSLRENARSLGQPVGRRRPDGPGSAHRHLRDGPRGGAVIGGGHDVETMRQEALVYQPHGVEAGVKSHSAKWRTRPSTSTFIIIRAGKEGRCHFHFLLS